MELDFYREHQLPLPQFHPDIRHEKRARLRSGLTLFLRKCDKTHETTLSIYPPEFTGHVYAEKAFLEMLI
jgi:hypothetical protein